jgi:OTU domain-containing protein 6
MRNFQEMSCISLYISGQIVAMKKSAGKADKKKKKELADEIARLEAELDARHQQELDVFLPKAVQVPETIPEGHETSHVGEVDGKANSADESTIPAAPGTPKLSKAQRRREKKSAEDAERQKRIEEETKALEENSLSKKEEEELALVLSQSKLSVHEIPADGNW